MKIIVGTSRAGRNIKNRAMVRADLRAHRAHHRMIAEMHSRRADALREYLKGMQDDLGLVFGEETAETKAVRAEIDRCDIIAMENMNSSCMGKENESWHDEATLSVPFNIPGM